MRFKHAAQVELRLDRDLGWRKKELTALRFLVESAQETQANVVLRAAIALLYAHWEGFVKEAAKAYLVYVSQQKLKLNQLQPNFIAISARGEIIACASARRVTVHTKLVRALTMDRERQARLPSRGVIATRSNLRAAVLHEIVESLGLDFAPFELKAKPVIDRLVKARNGIAHGRGNTVSRDDYVVFHSEVLALLDVFRDQVSGAIAGRAFAA